MPLVLDTNVVISGLLWNGPPRSLLDLIVSGDTDPLNLKSFHRIPIVTAAEALARITQGSTGTPEATTPA